MNKCERGEKRLRAEQKAGGAERAVKKVEIKNCE